VIIAIFSPVVATGSDIEVNTFTTSNQLEAAVATAPNGNFLVVWQSNGSGGTDSSGSSIQARQFDADGNPLGEQFQVNGYTTGNQWSPAVAWVGNSQYLVVWRGESSADAFGIVGRLVDAGLNLPAEPEFQINSHTTGTQTYPAVAGNDNGDCIVVWWGPSTDDDLGVVGQLFSSGTTPVGDNFQVNSHTTNLQQSSDVAMTPTGEFVAVWLGEGPGDTNGAHARRFDSSGIPLGDDFTVNTLAGRPEMEPAVAVDANGAFVVAYHTMCFGGGPDCPDNEGESVWARRFDSSGTGQGSEFPVNSFMAGRQSLADVAMTPTGEFIVVWESGNGNPLPDGSMTAVRGQAFTAAGSPDGMEFPINTVSPGAQEMARVAAQPGGEIVVVWGSWDDGGSTTGWDVRARVMYPGGLTIFTDGFESGSNSAWSDSVP
jgi:hypothetical protein